MAFGLPALGEGTWGQKLLDSINFLKSEQDGRLSDVSLSATYAPVARATQPTNSEPLWLSRNIKDLRVPAGPGERYTALTPTAGWEGTSCQEPNVFFANGVYNVLYTGGTGTGTGIGWATAPSPTGPWTKQGTTPVLGQGNGGFAGAAAHSNLYIEGGTAYLYFVDNVTGTTLHLATASLTNLASWTTSGTTWALPAGATLWGNVCIFKEADNTYTMVWEAFRSDWLLGIGTLGTSLTGTLTVQTSILSTLRVTPAGSTCGPILMKDGSTYVLYYHAAQRGSLPSEIYRATSTDKTTWTIDNNGKPLVTSAIANEVDQVADPSLVQTAEGDWWLFWTAADNPGNKFRVNGAPMLPTLRRRNSASGGYDRVESLTPPLPPSYSGPQYAVLTADRTTTSATNVDAGVTVEIVPRSTRVLVRIEAGASNTSPIFFAVNCPNTSVTKDAFVLTNPGGSAQMNGSRTVLFTGLTPGVAHQFVAKWRTTAGTATMRAAAFPAYEGLAMTVQDAGAPYGPYNA